MIDLPITSETADVEYLSASMSINMTPRKPSTPQPSKVKMRIKRPRNSWIIYRSEKSRQLHTDRPGMSAGAICTLCHRSYRLFSEAQWGMALTEGLATEVARLWKDETPEVKTYYGQLAELEAQEHKKRYPDYRYTPGR